MADVGTGAAIPPGDLELLSGAEALARAALRLGRGPVIASPSPPLEDLARVVSAEGGVLAFQDLEAAGLAFGAAAAGGVPLLAVSGPGLGRISEVISAACAAELPMVVVACTRGGPGTGNEYPAQTDYLLATRAPGTGGTLVPVVAPASPQEAADLLPEAFDRAVAEQTPVLVLLDSLVVRTREGIRLPGAGEGPAIRSRLGAGHEGVLGAAAQGKEATEALSHRLWEKARSWAGAGRSVAEGCEDAEVVLVAYGSAARVAETTLEKARKRGIRLGLFRPVDLRPFPEEALREALDGARMVLVVELCQGQMLEDVARLAPPQAEVSFYGRMGGAIPTPFELVHHIQGILGGES